MQQFGYIRGQGFLKIKKKKRDCLLGKCSHNHEERGGAEVLGEVSLSTDRVTGGGGGIRYNPADIFYGGVGGVRTIYGEMIVQISGCIVWGQHTSKGKVSPTESHSQTQPF